MALFSHMIMAALYKHVTRTRATLRRLVEALGEVQQPTDYLLAFALLDA